MDWFLIRFNKVVSNFEKSEIHKLTLFFILYPLSLN